MKVKIKEISIKVGEKEIKLTVEEAKELRNILENLFGRKNINYPFSIDPIQPYPIAPWITYESDKPYYTHKITCYEDGCVNIG